MKTPFDSKLRLKESLHWQGHPQKRFSISLLEMDGYYDARSGPSSILGFIFIFASFGNVLAYQAELYWAMILINVLSLGFILLPEILKHQRRKHTRYAFSEQRIFFQLWRWGNVQIQSIELEEVKRIICESNKKGMGTLYFMLKKPPGFFTKNF
ncbi:MAG: hypothetical protein AAFV80_03920, partial [Bacteroidota bacterium]